MNIYPQFIGRLGNNLFQIAACIGYAKRHNVKWGIKKGYIERGFNVDQVDRFLSWLPECHSSFRSYQEPVFNHRDIPFHNDGVRIVGFWQSEKYFQDAKDEVRKWIRPAYVDGYEDFCSIHVRRGDYVQYSASFPPVTPQYIFNAIAKMIQLNRQTKFIFFSDDIEWCKNLMQNGIEYEERGEGYLKITEFEIRYSEGKDVWTDLSMMASCGNHIISNSTLAWWGSWLGRNPDKKVVCPDHKGWFGPSNPNKDFTFDLYPKEWIEI